VRKPLRRRHSEMTAFDPIKSSVPEESVRKMPGIRVDGLCDTEAKAPTHVPTINTMSLEPGYGGKVQLTIPLFYRRALDRGLVVISGDSWATDAKAADPVHSWGSLMLFVTYKDSSHSVIELEQALLHVVLERGRVVVTAAGCTLESVTDTLARVKTVLPAKKTNAEHEASITFLAAEFETSRSLVVPTWDDIKTNYPPSVEEKLTAFIDRGSKQSGRLLLWPRLARNRKDLRPSGLGEGVARLVRSVLHPRSRAILRPEH
jgi:hypothetical protein